jgi:hypothetical protein
LANSREERIRELAYFLWEREGRPHGRAQAHWFRAEREADAGPVMPGWSPEHAGWPARHRRGRDRVR